FQSAARLSIAFLLFAPFFRRTPWRPAAFQMALGAVQFGAMYLAYNLSFNYLKSHQVALLTVTTPLWVALFESLRSKTLNRALWQAAGLATLGCLAVVWKPGGGRAFPLVGVLLIQLSNACFAFGQWAYRHWAKGSADRFAFSWMYLGATLVTLPFLWQHRHVATTLTLAQAGALAYLGLVASGVCFFLWNHGARRVSTARMAVMNDLKIPLGVIASTCFFHETPNLPRLAVGGGLLAVAVWMGRRG
ncbi:MAG: EamA family transporter, partial [Kiritimatiellaeota bacterium]|nr:EamA family transporter [Kiritimatiellota bacterium]